MQKGWGVPTSARMGEQAMIVVTYGIDKAIYNNPRNIHNIMLTTTIYALQMKKLVHVQFGTLFQNKLENQLRDKAGSSVKIPSEQFMLDDGKRLPQGLTRDEFENKRTQFDPKRMGKEQEILESYCYMDKRGRQEIVQIAITIKDNCMEAAIEFESAAQYKNFVQPAWLFYQ